MNTTLPDTPVVRHTLAEQIMKVSPEMPRPDRHQNYLEGLSTEALSARLLILRSQSGLIFSGARISLKGRGVDSARGSAAVPQLQEARREIPDTSVGRPNLNIEHPALETFPAVIESTHA